MPATGDRVPCVYVENHRVAASIPPIPISVSYTSRSATSPTGKREPLELLKMDSATATT